MAAAILSGPLPGPGYSGRHHDSDGRPVVVHHSQSIHHANHFHFAAIMEVAALFLGIFVTMISGTRDFECACRD
jgi:hypothetical protein